ncbi:Crp/Fnr family transcriptional regulator [Hymenobacter norwichensis]|uniref:Crp/Fnr family transcriptional regulator n=1 Tax=Hymenobacter norwichensis TaxID=223903 RepID=UPI0003FC4094|nr:cyclic nucleotide-binding domain-containing protein [Hymenobacter norwichensis]
MLTAAISDVFENYLRAKVQLTPAEWARLAALSSAQHLRKRQFLLHEGQVWQCYAFVCRGCLRQYQVDAKGGEHMLKFSIENWWAGDRESLLSGQPSRQNIDAL